MERTLLTIKETAERLAISRSKTYLLIASGELPTVAIGRSRRVLVRALEDFVRKLEDDASQQ